MDRITVVPLGDAQIQIHSDECMGAVLWPAANVLAAWLMEFASCPSLLELGCGAGLCGLAFAKTTGGLAVLTDLDDSLDLAQRNVELNGLPSCRVRPLDIGLFLQDEGPAIVKEFGHFPLVVGSDLCHDAGMACKILSAFDLMLGSDGRCVLALSANFESYVATVQALADAKGFKQELLLKTSCCTTLVVLVRGVPSWSLPPYLEDGRAAPLQPAHEKMDRADLLFA